MLGGYCIKYAIANLGDLFHAGWGVGDADSGEFFSSLLRRPITDSYLYCNFVLLTVLIVRGGVSEGIERFSTIAMPALFVLLVIVIVRSVTLEGALKAFPSCSNQTSRYSKEAVDQRSGISRRTDVLLFIPRYGHHCYLRFLYEEKVKT